MAKGRGVSRGINTGAAQVIRGIPQVDYAGQRAEKQAAEQAKQEGEELGQPVSPEALPEDLDRYQEYRRMLEKKAQEYEMIENKQSEEARKVYSEYNNGLRAMRDFAEIAKENKSQYDKYITKFIDNPKYDQEDVMQILEEYVSKPPFARLEMQRGGLPVPKLVPPEQEPWHPNFVKEVEASLIDYKDEQGYETIQQVYADPVKTQEIVKAWVENNKGFDNRGGGVIERYEIPTDQVGNIQWESEQGQQALEELTSEMVNRAGTKTARTEDEAARDFNLSFSGGSYRDDKYTYSYEKEATTDLSPYEMNYEEYTEKFADGDIASEEEFNQAVDAYNKAKSELKSKDSIFIGRTDSSENKPLNFVDEEENVVNAVPIGVTMNEKGEKVVVAIKKTIKGTGDEVDQYEKVELPHNDINRGRLATEYKYKDPETGESRNFNYDEMLELFSGGESSESAEGDDIFK